MITLLFWTGLAATAVLGWQSKRKWESYHRGQIDRVPMVNTMVAAGGAGAATLVMGLLKLMGL